MSNATLHKGNWLLLGADFQAYDGSPELVTAMTVNVTPIGQLTVEPVSIGASNREIYVSVPPGVTVGTTGILVDMVMQVPGPTGVSPSQKFARYTIDTIVPADLRGVTTRVIGPEQPLPHP
jgi:hypothetical protein